MSASTRASRVNAYLDELRTTQRHEIYRALQHPLYPILRKIERKHENLHHVTDAVAQRTASSTPRTTRATPTTWSSRSCSTTTASARRSSPPGINLFGGPLGLIHRHVTGAIPIRRNTQGSGVSDHAQGVRRRDAEEARPVLLPGRRPQLQRRAEAGEDRPDSRGAAPPSGPTWSSFRSAIAYDLVLEDHILARQRVKKRQRPFTRELAEMVRYAVGYRSRAFVTFGAPISVGGRATSQSRSDVLELTRLVRARIGALYKVLPTAVFAAAMRPSITRRDLETRIDRLIEELAARHANLGVTSGTQAVEEAAEPLETRGIVVAERGRFRVRERSVLRYYARTIEHLLVDARPDALMLDSASKAFFHLLARSETLKTLASRYGMRQPSSFARRFIAGETVEEAIDAARAVEARGLLQTLDLPRRERRRASTRPTRPRASTSTSSTRSSQSGIGRNLSLKLTQLGLDVDRASAVDNLRKILERAEPAGFFVRIDMESSAYTDVTLEIFETLWQQGYRQHRRRAAGGAAIAPSRICARIIALGARIRLVKGAYKEPKTVAYQKKADVDAAYARLMKTLLAERHTIRRSPRTTRR